MNKSGGDITSPYDLLRWAEEAIQDFKEETAAFFVTENCTMFREEEEKTGHFFQKIRLTKPIPDRFARRVTEALNNTRHAFDQSTRSLLIAHGGLSFNKSVYFPWSQTPTDLDRLLKERGVPLPFWKLFYDVEPYPRGPAHSGGDDVIRQLAQISGRRKHITRIAVSATVVGWQAPNVHIETMGPGQQVWIGGPRWDSVKNEMTLGKFPPGAQVDNKCRATFDVVFDEDPPLRRKGIVPLLDAFHQKAKGFTQSVEEAIT